MSDVSHRAEEMPPFIVMDVLARAQELEREGKNIVHMEIGEPDFDTPPPVVEAARKALADGATHYTPSLGLVELREAIAAYYHRKYGVEVSPDNIVVTAGTSPALLLVLQALLNPGEKVIMANPRYACYPNFVRAADGECIEIAVEERNNFRLPLEAAQEHLAAARAILINSPSNPTGTIQSAEELKALADCVAGCSGQQPYIISDEIYHGLECDGQTHTILEYTDRAFVLNGFSKRYAMTGWRLGWAIVPPDFVRPIEKLQQNLFICAGSIAQWAGIAALNECDTYVEQMAAEFMRRRERLLEGLASIGLPVHSEPKGAFYVFVNTAHVSNNSYELAFDILEKAGVALTPGIDFGSGGEGFLRLSYATSMEGIEEAIKRLGGYLQQRG